VRSDKIRCGLRERWPARLHGHVGRVSVVARRARATNVSSPLRPTIAAHATLSRFWLYLLFTDTLFREHKGEGRDKVIRIHSTHRPTNSSYNRRPEDSTSATQVPSRATHPAQPKYNRDPRRARARATTLKRITFTAHQHVHTYNFIRRLVVDDIYPKFRDVEAIHRACSSSSARQRGPTDRGRLQCGRPPTDGQGD
jgi:hypothetical protein